MIYLVLKYVQPKFGGKIIDIVSGDIGTPEKQAAALNAVRDTILEILLIVVVGYDNCLLTLDYICFLLEKDLLVYLLPTMLFIYRALLLFRDLHCQTPEDRMLSDHQCPTLL